MKCWLWMTAGLARERMTSADWGYWFVNEKKLGGKLKDLVDGVNEIGLKFGIWFEPEMISEDSDLYGHIRTGL